MAENGFERVEVDDRVEADEEDCAITGGWGVPRACDVLLRAAAEVDALETFDEAIARWMAAIAAALRADACEDAACNALPDDEADLAVAFGVQVCDVGKRCCGQNCCLHFYVRKNVSASFELSTGQCAHITPNRSIQHLPALRPGTGWVRTLARLPGQNHAIRVEVRLHLDIRVLSRRDGDRGAAEGARWRDAVVEVRVELVALVRLREEMVAAESVGAVLALNREEVDEHACRRGALGADGEEPRVAVGCG